MTDRKRILGVPFRSQSWELEHWQKLTFASREEARYWERSSCGVLCLGMAAEYFGMKRSTKELIDQGLVLGAYTEAAGWSHAGLVKLAHAIGLDAKQQTFTLIDLQKAIDENQVPIVSVKPGFRTDKSLKERLLFWKRYGGHLVTVVGYKLEQGHLFGFFVHHTSSGGNDWQGQLIPLETFRRSFSGRGIVVSKGD